MIFVERNINNYGVRVNVWNVEYGWRLSRRRQVVARCGNAVLANVTASAKRRVAPGKMAALKQLQ